VPELIRYHESAGLTLTLTPGERSLLECVNQKVGGQASLAEILDFLAQALQGVAPCDRFSLAFVSEHGRRVTSHYTRAMYEPVLLHTGYTEDVADSSLAEVLRRGVPRVIADLEQYLAARPSSRSTRLLVKEGVRASLTCPLMVDGRVVGLLFRSSRRAGVYDEHQVALHAALAERLSQAVEKAYRIEQLGEANRQYFELLTVVTHELRTPLASMVTEANLLRDGYLGELQPKQRAAVERMVRQGQHLLGLVGDYLELGRLEGGQLRYAPRGGVDFAKEVLGPALELVAVQLEARDMEVQQDVPPDLPAVALDPQLMRIVLVNLLGNAVKYGREHGIVRVRARCDGARLVVGVWNEGAGWPASEQSRLFKKFSRLQTPELLRQKGTGVGLYTCWRIVQWHGGHLRGDAELGRWAEFTCELPQPPAAVAEVRP
jgi:signal transduction histidine kinase